MGEVDAYLGGRYRLDRQLASGGMGTVWQGWDERLRRPVAVKRMSVPAGLNQAEREVAVNRAMREARIAARLHHPNAVQVFDVIDEGDSPCLIMQYVPSRSLQEVLQAHGPLSAEQVRRIGTQVAAALAAAHRAGIVHRDVKPGNVLIAEDGTAKITDFGISHAFEEITLTSTGMVTGTPAFLAPEVARGAVAGFASDVYSLAATLYTAVEGTPPYGTDPNPMAVLHRVASGQPRPPTRSGPLTGLLTAMMAGDPAARPSMIDIGNALSDLHSIAGDAPPDPATQLLTAQWPTPPAASPAPGGNTRSYPAPPPGPGPAAHPAPRPEVRKRRRSWLPITAALVLIAVATASAIALLNRSGHATNRASAGSSPPARSPSLAPSGSATSISSAPPSSPSAVPPPPGSATSISAAPSSASPANENGAPSDQELANAIVDYFNLMPDNLDAGWALLTPQFQATKAQSRQGYDSFWNSIDRVDVSNVTGQAPDGATATLSYHYKDGRVVTEQTQFRLVRQDGVLKIDQES